MSLKPLPPDPEPSDIELAEQRKRMELTFLPSRLTHTVVKLGWQIERQRVDPNLFSEPIAPDKLTERLLDVFKTRQERVCFVKGDPDLEFQEVARAIDLAKGAQMDKVGLMTAKMEYGQ